jgi:uncharacterized protein (TIGR00251 family)
VLTESKGQLRLAVHVQPGAKRNGIAAVHDHALKIAVSAPAVDGKANDALTAIVAQIFAIPPRAVAVVAGHTSRRKVLSLAGITMADAALRLAVALRAVGVDVGQNA